MGLLDMLGMGGPAGKVRRLQKKASAKFGPAENRQGAIEELGALKGLLPEADVVKFLVEVARKVGGEYSRVPEKKVLLLHALSAHKSSEIAPAVLPFLDDMDDEVQIAAAEVIARQQDPVGREPL